MKIDYITHHGVAEWVNFAEDNSDFLTVRTREKHTGAVSIGTHVFVLKNGEARIPRSSLPDGEYHPRIECAEGVFVAEGFIKNGKSVRPLPLSEERIRKLFSRMRDLEDTDSYTKRPHSSKKRTAAMIFLILKGRKNEKQA